MKTKKVKIKRQLFSVMLDEIDTQRLIDIARIKQMTKSQAFREWLKNASRSIEAAQQKEVA